MLPPTSGNVLWPESDSIQPFRITSIDMAWLMRCPFILVTSSANIAPSLLEPSHSLWTHSSSSQSLNRSSSRPRCSTQSDIWNPSICPKPTLPTVKNCIHDRYLDSFMSSHFCTMDPEIVQAQCINQCSLLLSHWDTKTKKIQEIHNITLHHTSYHTA
jgi:hypothetical protein